MINITSIISNIAMISNAIATIAVLLRGQSNMYQMGYNPGFGVPTPMAQAPGTPYPTCQQPQLMTNQNNYGYGYGYQEPVQQTYQTNSMSVNQGYQFGQMTQSYNNQYCNPMWSIDPSRCDTIYQPRYSNNYDNNIWLDYRCGMEQNPYVYEYNYDAHNHQSRRAFDNYINNHNSYPYNWPYAEDITDSTTHVQQPASPWAKPTPQQKPIQHWNQNFLNKEPSTGQWTGYDSYGRPEHRDAYLFA